MNEKEQYQIPDDSIITVAGTVGAGKSTLAAALAETLEFKTSFEKINGNPYLEKFYDNFERWSFHLQVYFLSERFKEQKRIFEAGGGYVQDRSIYEDTAIFARMHYDKGTMSKTDYETYTSLFDAMVMTPYFPHPDLLIYLEGSFDDILTRIAKRGREMEKNTPISYWEEMFARYEAWIDQFDSCPVLRLNINDYDLLEEKDAVHLIAEKAGNMIHTARNT